MIELKTLVIGFGFSCIPLLRELDRTGEAYEIISDPIIDSIWANLDKANTINFDMVSSYYTSFYSFDMVKDFKTDYYSLAKDFYAMHMSYYHKYKHRIIPGHVTSIENHEGFSIVHTANGPSYKAINVVVSTGFERKIINSLCNFDFTVTNKTIVIDGLGDSPNLMIARLIAGNNRLISTVNGFALFDKVFHLGERTVTFDQIEYHNIGLLRNEAYRDTIWGSPYVMQLIYLSGWRRKLSLVMGKLLFPNIFYYKHYNFLPRITCDPKRVYAGSPVPHGIIAIKHWTIDVYSRVFGNNLEKAMQQGYLLNDIALWIDLGMVEIFNKSESTINCNNKTIEYNGETVNYDYLIETGAETPRHPPITICRNGTPVSKYVYSHREKYFGAIPQKLSNIFIIGNTRPSSGGLANLTEMQGLLVHKMIADNDFKNMIYSSIDERIAKYNQKYYFNDIPAKTDHVVFYGFFTEDIAKVLGINLRLRDCKNYKEVSKFFFFPNNTFKYRQKGEYKVDGCEELVEFIDKNNNRWIQLKLFAVTMRLLNIMMLIMTGRAYAADIISLPVAAGLLFVLYNMRHLIIAYCLYAQSPIQYSNTYRFSRFWLTVFFVICSAFISPTLFLPLLVTELGITILVRLFKPELAKTAFNDLRVKKSYAPFLAKYLDTYRALFLNTNRTDTTAAIREAEEMLS